MSEWEDPLPCPACGKPPSLETGTRDRGQWPDIVKARFRCQQRSHTIAAEWVEGSLGWTHETKRLSQLAARSWNEMVRRLTSLTTATEQSPVAAGRPAQ